MHKYFFFRTYIYARIMLAYFATCEAMNKREGNELCPETFIIEGLLKKDQVVTTQHTFVAGSIVSAAATAADGAFRLSTFNMWT